MIRFFLHQLSKHLPCREITGRDESPYLLKFLLWGRSNGTRVHLHQFLRGDADPELHNHPWELAVSLVLAGGYFEERRAGDDVVTHEVRPGHLNIIRSSTFHRVELREVDCWTLFVSGPAVQTWGFWNRESGVFTGWKSFNAARGIKPSKGQYWKAYRVAE